MDEHSAQGVINIARGETVSNAQIAEVFATHGWRLDLTGGDVSSIGPTCDVRRLAELGVTPRGALTRVAEAISADAYFTSR